MCKHVQAYVHARPDWDQGILEQALDYVGSVPIPMLALISSSKVSRRASEGCLPISNDVVPQHLPKGCASKEAVLSTHLLMH